MNKFREAQHLYWQYRKHHGALYALQVATEIVYHGSDF